MNKNNVWEYDETKELLNVMVDQKCLKQLHGKTNTPSEIFKEVEAELKKRGFANKNEKQVENRWKNLKSRYLMVKNKHIENGKERSVCPFYDELSSMLESSPKSDTSEDDESNSHHPKKMRLKDQKIEKRMPVKRNIWEYEETKELLNIMVEQESLKHFNGKHYKNVEIYKKIETELKRRGFLNKNDKQIENRWKNLKKEYCKVKRMNGNGNEITLCPFFEEIGNMLEYRIPSNYKEEDTILDENSDGLFLQELSSGSSEETVFEPKLSEKLNSSEDSMTKTTSDFTMKKRISHKPKFKTMNRFSTRIRRDRKLAKQVFEDQKKLIDYEFSLYLKHEEQLQKHFEESTKKILEENTKNFLQGLKSILYKNSSDSKATILDNLINFSTEEYQ